MASYPSTFEPMTESPLPTNDSNSTHQASDSLGSGFVAGNAVPAIVASSVFIVAILMLAIGYKVCGRQRINRVPSNSNGDRNMGYISRFLNVCNLPQQDSDSQLESLRELARECEAQRALEAKIALEAKRAFEAKIRRDRCRRHEAVIQSADNQDHNQHSSLSVENAEDRSSVYLHKTIETEAEVHHYTSSDDSSLEQSRETLPRFHMTLVTEDVIYDIL